MRKGPSAMLRPFASVGIVAPGVRCDAFLVRTAADRSYPSRPSRRSTRFRLLPTFLIAFFTEAADRLVFFAV
jgi:hypothetical protein